MGWNRYKEMPTYVRVPLGETASLYFKAGLIGTVIGFTLAVGGGCSVDMNKLAEKTGKAKAAQMEVCRKDRLHAPVQKHGDRP
jgi:hypothetical protein